MLIVPHALHSVDGCCFAFLTLLTAWHTVSVSVFPPPPPPHPHPNPFFLARLDEVQKSSCTTPGVSVSVGVRIYFEVFSMAYIVQIT